MNPRSGVWPEIGHNKINLSLLPVYELIQLYFLLRRAEGSSIIVGEQINFIMPRTARVQKRTEEVRLIITEHTNFGFYSVIFFYPPYSLTLDCANLFALIPVPSVLYLTLSADCQLTVSLPNFLMRNPPVDGFIELT